MKGKKILNEKLSMTRLAELVSGKRKEKSMTQQELADATGINRSLLSRLEKKILFHQFHNWKVLENALDLIRMKHLLNSPLPGCHLLLL